MVKVHEHALKPCKERGATTEEVISAIESGETFPGKFGRTGFRLNLLYNSVWNGKYYATKQIEAYAVKKNEDWIVITIFVKYF
jgi:hypothetical protein